LIKKISKVIKVENSLEEGRIMMGILKNEYNRGMAHKDRSLYEYNPSMN
jgi:hypothetical protein